MVGTEELVNPKEGVVNELPETEVATLDVEFEKGTDDVDNDDRIPEEAVPKLLEED